MTEEQKQQRFTSLMSLGAWSYRFKLKGMWDKLCNNFLRKK